MKNLLRIAALLVTAACSSTVRSEPETFMSFDFKDGQIENGFGDWFYSDKGENPCGVYAGDQQSKLCSLDGLKAYAYYNGYNNKHMGWMRYGFIDSGSTNSVSGSSLKIKLTGGVKEGSDGTIQEYGIYTKAKSDASALKIQSTSLDSNEILPGDLSLYFKTQTSESKFSGLQGKNRLSVWVLMPPRTHDFDKQSKTYSSRPSHTFSWYPFIGSSKGGHYYHSATNISMGGWTKIQFDAHPTHHNSGAHNQYSAFEEGGYDYPGDGTGYFNNITTFALRNGFSSNQPTYSEFYIDNLQTDYVPYENEETISTLGIGYNPDQKRFDISFEDKYRCPTCVAKYIVKYSFEPINNENFDVAYTPISTINFNRSLNNESGIIYKPNSGYNQVWAAFDLRAEHRDKLLHGTNIYFAVKDISDRSAINQQAADFRIVNVPNIGETFVKDLVKTISYQILDVEFPISVEGSKRFEPIVGHEFSGKLDIWGGKKPYRISGQLPSGLAVSNDGLIHGVPSQKEFQQTSITISDAKGNQQTISVVFDIKTEDDFDVPHCGLVVDFKESKTASVISDARFSNIITDKYTGFVETGTTIKVGSNGSYDFTAITGDGYALKPGDSVRLTWKNQGNETLWVAPNISFNHVGRISGSDSSLWQSMPGLSIKPGSVEVIEYKVTEDIYSTSLNVNSNTSNTNELVLEKIEFVELSRPKEDICKRYFPPGSNKESALVDFENSQSESVMRVRGLNSIVMDKYTSIVGIGSTTVTGNNGGYNFQGVTGEGYEFVAGDIIRVYWKNISNEILDASPLLSFTEKGRYSSERAGSWLELGSFTLKGGEEVVQTFVFDAATAQKYNVINVSNQSHTNSQLLLDKITLQSSNDSMGFHENELNTAIQYQNYKYQLSHSASENAIVKSNSQLPLGLQLESTGLITGKPQEFGDFVLDLVLIDTDGKSVEQQLRLTIIPHTMYSASNCEAILSFDNNGYLAHSESVDIVNTDRYTGFTEFGTSIVVGTSSSYDFTAVSGTFEFTTSSSIRTIWYNNSDEDITFTPEISFTNMGRKSEFDSEATWNTIESITVKPKSYMVATYRLGPVELGFVNGFNINVNYNNNRLLALNKIELVDDSYPGTSSCELPR